MVNNQLNPWQTMIGCKFLLVVDIHKQLLIECASQFLSTTQLSGASSVGFKSLFKFQRENSSLAMRDY